MAEKNDFQLEDAFEELEDIIRQLESEELPLKDALELYGNGVKLVSACKDELTGIEKEMIIIEERLTQDSKEE